MLFGSGYTVTEGTLPAGWDFANLDCSASKNVTPSISDKTLTFAIDDSADVLDCTYTNRARGSIVVEKITDDGSAGFDFTSGTFTPSPFTLTTTAAGAGGKDSRTFSNLNPGTYDVAETVPAGWNLVSSTCSDGSNPSSIGLSGGESVTCTFHDAREKGAIVITKTRKHAADGPGDHPHQGVTFKVTGGELPAAGVTSAATNAAGKTCVDGLVLSCHQGVGDYTVHENTPTGYKGEADKTVTVDTEASCDLSSGHDSTNGETVSFHNTPLTDLDVSVDSQVAGGTDSQINCVNDADLNTSIASHDTDSTGDGTASASDLEPGNYTCTVVIDP